MLAGGQGRRFGRDKRVAEMPSGQTLLEATLGKIIPAFEETLVVLRPGDDALA
ncbi:MAG: NTP transferase domain-containing protein, partial [Pseudomonadales bacterium]